MSPAPKPALTLEAARLLLSEHLEGNLDADVKAELDALLTKHPALAAERKRLSQTRGLLLHLARPEPPADVVQKVRARLAAEKRASLAAVHDAPPPPARRSLAMDLGLGLFAAASLALVIFVAAGDRGTADGTSTAGIADTAAAVPVTLVTPLPADLVATLAARAGMTTLGEGTFEGDRRDAARFLLALKTEAATRGVDVSGFLPDAERLRIEVTAE